MKRTSGSKHLICPPYIMSTHGLCYGMPPNWILIDFVKKFPPSSHLYQWTADWESAAAPTFPGAWAWAVHLHTPYQGDNSQHMLKKETASIHTKNSPHPSKKLNPHKL